MRYNFAQGLVLRKYLMNRGSQLGKYPHFSCSHFLLCLLPPFLSPLLFPLGSFHGQNPQLSGIFGIWGEDITHPLPCGCPSAECAKGDGFGQKLTGA